MPAPATAPIEAAPTGPLRRVVLLVAYDGGPYRGFAPQGRPDVATVGDSLIAAIASACRLEACELRITCAGRTDAGVHAAGQVVHVDLPPDALTRYEDAPRRAADAELVASPAGLTRETAETAETAEKAETGETAELPRLAKAVSSLVDPTIVVLRARVAPPGFDARHSATARRYRYEILRRPAPDPLRRATTWHVPGELDLSAMRIAADAVLGEHDFTGFCKRPPGHDGGPITRRVTTSRWRAPADDDTWTYDIEANAFCHHMVRSIVATLVGVGQGRVTAATLLGVLRTGGRAHGGQLAPPQGLCLQLVRYPDELVAGGVLREPT